MKIAKGESPDFLDPETFRNGIPHATYRMMRDEAPVSWHVSSDGGYWLVTRHEDVVSALRNPGDFSSALGSAALHQLSEAEIQNSRLMLNSMDPPEHARFRRLVTRPFALSVIEQRKSRIQEMTDALLDEVAERESCDVVRDLAELLPMRVIFELLGVPESDHARLAELSNALMHVDDADLGGSRSPEHIIHCVQQLVGYFIQLAHEKRAHPKDDLMTKLSDAEVDGDRLTDQELGLFFIPLLAAGHETTRSLIACGLHLLSESPDLYRRLSQDRALLPGAIEEMIRVVSPVIQLRRTATREFEFGGQTLHRGDRVVIALVSANYDERVFEEPLRFDPERTPNPHVAFGMGPHLCFGAALSRLEAQVFFSRFFDRFAAIETTGPAARVNSVNMNTLKAMPVRLSRAH
jgi:cytochrome P450